MLKDVNLKLHILIDHIKEIFIVQEPQFSFALCKTYLPFAIFPILKWYVPLLYTALVCQLRAVEDHTTLMFEISDLNYSTNLPVIYIAVNYFLS
jgi:hypothetical protein